MKYRVIVVVIINNSRGEFLICKKPKNLGIFPGQWALPGGGIEEKEKMLEAVEREVKEETGLRVSEITPLYFTDDLQKKYLRSGTVEKHYMIYLYFRARAADDRVKLGEEFEDYSWVKIADLGKFDLNKATVKTFKKLGFLKK
jgi:nucleoside triphosphatase